MLDLDLIDLYEWKGKSKPSYYNCMFPTTCAFKKYFLNYVKDKKNDTQSSAKRYYGN